jgi:hypothetical protein
MIVIIDMFVVIMLMIKVTSMITFLFDQNSIWDSDSSYPLIAQLCVMKFYKPKMG